MSLRRVCCTVVKLAASLNRTPRRSLWRLIDIHPKVQLELERKKPLVALESTIITHGMPFPQNIETAIEVEDLVRSNGATPATIAVIDGRIRVGLSREDLVKLTKVDKEQVIKCSKRDLPYAVAMARTAGTTVAATIAVAHMVGIRVFATGGIGGVHREGHFSMDVSADLVELGRTPVAVICSGVKSILDIPRTLEYLETQGVCVAAYGTKNGTFPDFYTRDSGCKVPYSLCGPKQAARLIEVVQQLKLNSALLIGVPIPEEYAADKVVVTEAIEQAYAEAQKKGVTGKEVTPFLLAAIAAITKGSSLAANIALIKNNAAVAAQIACELYNLRRIPMKHKKRSNQKIGEPLIVGATILDLSFTMLDDSALALNGATYHTQAKQSAGGVGRNLAEGIFKLYGSANFLSVVGGDHLGKSLLQLMPESLRQGVYVDPQKSTSLCSIVFDMKGDCKICVANMDIHESITPELIRQHEQMVRSASLIVIDGNLSLNTIEVILKLAKQHRRIIFFEPTDMLISGKPFQLPSNLTERIRIISPNIYELKTIVEMVIGKAVQWTPSKDVSLNVLLMKIKEMLSCISHRFDCILVTLGSHGVVVGLRGGGFKLPLFDIGNGEYCQPPETSEYAIRFYAAPKVERIINVSGAGDSFSSGFITGLLRGYNIDGCIAFAFVAAKCALQSEAAVPTQYFTNAEDEQSLFQHTLLTLEVHEM